MQFILLREESGRYRDTKRYYEIKTEVGEEELRRVVREKYSGYGEGRQYLPIPYYELSKIGDSYELVITHPFND